MSATGGKACWLDVLVKGCGVCMVVLAEDSNSSLTLTLREKRQVQLLEKACGACRSVCPSHTTYLSSSSSLDSFQSIAGSVGSRIPGCRRRLTLAQVAPAVYIYAVAFTCSYVVRTLRLTKPSEELPLAVMPLI